MSRPIIKLQPGRQSMAFCSTHVPVRLPPCRTGECSAPCKPPRTTGTPGEVPARYIHGLARWTRSRTLRGPHLLGTQPARRPIHFARPVRPVNRGASCRMASRCPDAPLSMSCPRIWSRSPHRLGVGQEICPLVLMSPLVPSLGLGR